MILVLPILKINTLQEITCFVVAIYVLIEKVNEIQRQILYELKVKTGLILSMSFDMRINNI